MGRSSVRPPLTKAHDGGMLARMGMTVEGQVSIANPAIREALRGMRQLCARRQGEGCLRQGQDHDPEGREALQWERCLGL